MAPCEIWYEISLQQYPSQISNIQCRCLVTDSTILEPDTWG